MKIKTNGIQLHYTVEGEGPWLAMSHSLACDSSMWNEQMELLTKSFRVLRFDTRGHGASDAPAGDYTLDMLAEDVLGMFRALNIDRCHWVGLSMGGMIGQTLALKSPGLFTSMVLADTTSRYGADAASLWEGRMKTAREQGMKPLVDGTLSRWFTEPYRKGHPETMKRFGDNIASTPVAGYCGCCAAISKINVTDRLKQIKCPVQIIVGEQDAGTPVEKAREIHAAIPGSELVVIPSAAHISNVEQPEAFNRALGDFYKRQR